MESKNEYPSLAPLPTLQVYYFLNSYFVCELWVYVQHELIQDEEDKEYSAIAICPPQAGNSNKGPFFKAVWIWRQQHWGASSLYACWVAM